MRTSLVLIPALLGTLALQAKTPSLTGTWKANIEKSSFGAAVPKALVYKVSDTAGGLLMTAVETDAEGNQRTSELKFDRKGKETLNRIGGLEARTKLSDDEDALREVTTFDGPSGSFTRKSVIKLSGDGKVLTMDSVISQPRGDTPVRIVLEKQ